MKTKTPDLNHIDTFFSNNFLQLSSTNIKLIRLLPALLVSVLSFVNVSGQTASRVDSKIQARVASERPKLSVQLLLNEKVGNENSADGFTAIFDENFSKNIGDEDAYKFSNLDEKHGDRSGWCGPKH